MQIENELPENVIRSREACLVHADDLIRAAKRILSDEKLPHVSYHLAVLALEEIGKSHLVIMGHLKSIADDTGEAPQRLYDDHIKKLFWATWGPSIGREKITKDQIDLFQGLSQKLHNTRLQASYVDFDVTGPFQPSEAITEPEAQRLIDMATARLEIEKMHKLDKIDEDHLKTVNWFLSTSDDREKRKVIFGNQSMEKLAELGSTNEWMDWLKKEFDRADAEAMEIAIRYIQQKPGMVVQRKDKWKIRIRFFTNSHSIRPKTLKQWNAHVSFIRLYPVGGKKDQFIAELILPNNITVHSLWSVGWGMARSFVVALNIATQGCFWWYVPEQISRFYEDIIDLENPGDELKIERNPILKIGWPHNALSEDDLRLTALYLGMIPNNDESELGKGIGAYITALSFLNKTDIHFQFEANSYDFFYKALKHGMKYFKEWDERDSFSDRLEKLLLNYEGDRNEIDKHKHIWNQLERENPCFDEIKLSLSEVGEMRFICDAYFILKFHEIAKQRSADRKESKSKEV